LGTCSRIAMVIGSEMLSNNGIHIYPQGTPLTGMSPVNNLSTQLSGRYLLRYLLPHQLGRFLNGTSTRQYVTPTPYAPEETASWLALPAPDQPRPYDLVLDPTQLHDVFRPRWVQMGGGIEYILNTGFLSNAIANVSPDPSTSPAKWELEIK
jgi:hypothetical protein